MYTINVMKLYLVNAVEVEAHHRKRHQQKCSGVSFKVHRKDIPRSPLNHPPVGEPQPPHNISTFGSLAFSKNEAFELRTQKVKNKIKTCSTTFGRPGKKKNTTQQTLSNLWVHVRSHQRQRPE